jgi:hypothetical protein
LTNSEPRGLLKRENGEHALKNWQKKQVRIKAELEEARRKQFADRDHMLTQQAKAERDDFLRII